MPRTMPSETSRLPRIVDVGLTGMLVTFSGNLTDDANRSALSFRNAVEGLQLAGVTETSTSLTSTFVSFDPLVLKRETLREILDDLLKQQDWTAADMPDGRVRWTIPAVFGGASGPQLEEASGLADIDPDTAIKELCGAPLRVMTIGFAPGQPYLGSLPENWNIPRQTGLTKRVPVGAITVAIRQIVLFSTSTPTGWRQVGLCGFRAFRPEARDPFALRPGDEIRFRPVSLSEYDSLQAQDTNGDGGAASEVIA